MQLILGLLPIWPFALLLALSAVSIWSSATSNIRHLPGPFVARFSKLWRIYKFCLGQGPQNSRILHATYGPVVRTGPNDVSLSDPDAIKKVYDARNAYRKNSLYNVLKPVYRGTSHHTIVTAPHSSETKDMRSMLYPCMFGDPFTHVKVIEDSLLKLADCMHGSAGEAVDFFVWPCYWAYDMTFAMLFGEYLGFMESRMDIRRIVTGIIELSRAVPALGMLPGLVGWTTGNARFMSIAERCSILPDPLVTLFEEVEKRVDAHNSPGHVCGDAVLCRILQKEKTPLTQSRYEFIVLLLFEAFLAQAVDLAATVRTLVFVLLTHGQEYNKITKLVRNACPTESQSLETITYLNAVITETLRIHPTMAMQLERTVPAEGLCVNGHQIPPGTSVSVAHAVTHVDGNVFGPDAQDFRPTRWLEFGTDPDQMVAMRSCLLIFGKGNRICPGRDLGMLALRMFMKEMLGRFRVTLAEGDDRPTCRAFWFTEVEPLSVIFEPHH